MGYLKNTQNGAVSQLLNSDSAEYQKVSALRIPGSANLSLWEEVAEEDVNFGGPRAIILNEPGAAVGADETVTMPGEPGRPGNITQANLFTDADLIGAATNSRTITVVQGSAQGAGSPARTVLATLALVAGVNALKGAASPNFTINQAAFIGGAPLEVASTHIGTGIADPGGLVVVLYTPV